jgi:hypothetical protein
MHPPALALPKTLQNKLQTHPLVREDGPQQETEILRQKTHIVMSSKRGQDTKIGWPTDRR